MNKKELLQDLTTVEDLDYIKKVTKDNSSHDPITDPYKMPKPISWQSIDSDWKLRLKRHWWSTNYGGLVNDNMLPMFELREKLLSFGGEEVCLPYHEEDLNYILTYGQFWYGDKTILKKGEPGQCHSNSGYLWDTNRDKTLIATGYALSDDGMWRQHSWCLSLKEKSNKIVETTKKRVAYFGFVMTYKMSEEFYYDNE